MLPQNVLFCFLAGLDLALELSVLKRLQDLPKKGAGTKPHLLEVIPCQQALRADLLGRRHLYEATDELVGIQVSVAGETIEPVQRQMFGKARLPNKLLQRRGAHPFDGSELHMVVYQRKNLLGVLVGKAQPLADGLGHTHADFDVVVEANAVAGLRGGLKCRWLANVVE